MTPIEILKGAREFLSKPERWCKGYAAKDERGRVIYDGPMSVSYADAAKHCLIGACYRAARGFGGERVLADLEKALPPMPRSRSDKHPIARFNDSRTTTHADILALLDRAIARLEAKHD